MVGRWAGWERGLWDGVDVCVWGGGRCGSCASACPREAVRGSETNVTVSNPFLEYSFRTKSNINTVASNVDGTLSDEQDTVVIIPGQAVPFHHTDRNTLRKVGEPTPNPTAQAAATKLRKS